MLLFRSCASSWFRSGGGRSRRSPTTVVLRSFFLLVIGATIVVASQPAAAGIIQTQPAPASTWSPLLPLTVSLGFEFETDSERTEYNLPLLLEYNVTENLRLAVEPTFASIRLKTGEKRTVSGLGDLETSVEYEFLRELRYRPALTLEGLVRWPTASDPDLGSPGTDYSLGLIASKDLVVVNLEFGVQHTFTGDTESGDTTELTLAAVYPVSQVIDLEAEVVYTLESGEGGAAEGTIGLAWHVNENLTVGQGILGRDDGSWQTVTTIGWSVSGGD